MSEHGIGSAAPRAIAWLVVCAALTGLAALRGVDAELSGLVPSEHQNATDTYLLVRLTPAAGDDVLDAALAGLDELGGRCPLAPPAAEARRWLDAHALTLLPRERHAALARRLEPAALRVAVAGARARLTSPFAGLVGDDLRRDPLGLHDLAEDTAGRLGVLAPGAGPEPSARGDLIAADGRRALLRFCAGPSVQELLDAARGRVADLPVELAAVGGPARDDAARAGLAAAPRVLLGLAAALTLVLALALRRVRPVLALLLTVLGPAALLAAAIAPLGALDLPLLVLAVGVSAAPARPDATISALSALALAPLLLTPYPAWRAWAIAWALALAAAGLCRRLVQPHLLAALGAPADERPPLGPPGPPALRLAHALPAALACAVVLSFGAWSFRHVRFDPPSPTPLADPALAALEAEVRAEFFDPDAVAVLHSPGDDTAAALARAAADLSGLQRLLPDAALRLDAPGAFVVPEPELDARLAGLQGFDIRGRLELLRVVVAEHGMRPDAFGEFLRDAAHDLDEPPTPAAALAGPLGPWLAQRAGEGGVETRVYLSPQAAGLPPLAADDGRPLVLRGPAVAARAERERFSGRLGLAAAAGAWLSAFVVWLSTRRLALALALALAAITAQCGLVLLLWLFGRPAGPSILPVFLLAGSAAAVAGLRAVRALASGRPLVDPGRLANALGPLAAVLALLVAPEPAWRHVGLATALAVLAAHATGGLAAPSLYALLDRAAARLSPRT